MTIRRNVPTRDCLFRSEHAPRECSTTCLPSDVIPIGLGRRFAAGKRGGGATGGGREMAKVYEEDEVGDRSTTTVSRSFSALFLPLEASRSLRELGRLSVRSSPWITGNDSESLCRRVFGLARARGWFRVSRSFSFSLSLPP